MYYIVIAAKRCMELKAQQFAIYPFVLMLFIFAETLYLAYQRAAGKVGSIAYVINYY